MPRWKEPPKLGRGRERLEREFRVLAGTMLPSDQMLIGREAFRIQAEEAGLKSASQIRAAVNTMSGQPWMLTLPNGTKATCVSSADYWYVYQRHEVAHLRMVEAGRASGRLPPKPGARERGRPHSV